MKGRYTFHRATAAVAAAALLTGIGWWAGADHTVHADPVLSGTVTPIIVTGDLTSDVTAINTRGDVTGYSTAAAGQPVAFINYARIGDNEPRIMHSLKVPQGYVSTEGLALNETYRVAGFAVDSNGTHFPFLDLRHNDHWSWTSLNFPDVNRPNQGFVKGGEATGMSVTDRIPMFDQTAGGVTYGQFAERPWGAIDFRKHREIRSTVSGHQVVNSFTGGIDEDGRVAGAQQLETGQLVATLWQRDRTPVLLQGLSSTGDSRGMALTEGGDNKNSDIGTGSEWVEIAGYSGDDTGAAHPVLWFKQGTGPNLTNFGHATDLGIPAGFAFAQALGISHNATYVVGYARTSGSQNSAFLWWNGQSFNLNDLLPDGSGWTLERANGVNNRGQIVGQGTYNGNETGFLLRITP